MYTYASPNRRVANYFFKKNGHKKTGRNTGLIFYVPGTGFEPAHPCERCDLNTVRLPISPPGQGAANIELAFIFY